MGWDHFKQQPKPSGGFTGQTNPSGQLNHVKRSLFEIEQQSVGYTEELKLLQESTHGAYNAEIRKEIDDRTMHTLETEFKQWLNGTHDVYNKRGDRNKAQVMQIARSGTLRDPERVDPADFMNTNKTVPKRHTPWGQLNICHLPGVREYVCRDELSVYDAKVKDALLLEQGPQDIAEAWEYFIKFCKHKGEGSQRLWDDDDVSRKFAPVQIESDFPRNNRRSIYNPDDYVKSAVHHGRPHVIEDDFSNPPATSNPPGQSMGSMPEVLVPPTPSKPSAPVPSEPPVASSVPSKPRPPPDSNVGGYVTDGDDGDSDDDGAPPPTGGAVLANSAPAPGLVRDLADTLIQQIEKLRNFNNPLTNTLDENSLGVSYDTESETGDTDYDTAEEGSVDEEGPLLLPPPSPVEQPTAGEGGVDEEGSLLLPPEQPTAEEGSVAEENRMKSDERLEKYRVAVRELRQRQAALMKRQGKQKVVLPEPNTVEEDEADSEDEPFQANASDPVSVVTEPPTGTTDTPPSVPDPQPSVPEASPADVSSAPPTSEPPLPPTPESSTTSRKRRKPLESEGDPNFTVATNLGTQNVDPTDNPDIAALEAKVAKQKAEYETLEGAYEASEEAMKTLNANALEQEQAAQEELDDIQQAHDALTQERDRLIGVIQRYTDLLAQDIELQEQADVRNEAKVQELKTALEASYAKIRRLDDDAMERQTKYLALLFKERASQVQIKAAEEKLEQLQMLRDAEAQAAGELQKSYDKLNEIALENERIQAEDEVEAAAALEAHRVQLAQLQQQLDQSSAAIQAMAARDDQLLATVESSLANIQSDISNLPIDAPQAGSSSSTALTVLPPQPSSVLKNKQIARQLKKTKLQAARVQVLTTQRDIVAVALRDTDMRLASSQAQQFTAEERRLLQRQLMNLHRQHADYVTQTDALLARLREASRVSLSHPQRWLHPQIVAAELQALEAMLNDREQAFSSQAALLQTAEDQLASERRDRTQEQADQAQVLNNTRNALLDAEAVRRRQALVTQVEANRQERQQAWATLSPEFRSLVTEAQFEHNVTNQIVNGERQSLTPEILQSIVNNGQNADQAQVLAALRALNTIVTVGTDREDPTHRANNPQNIPGIVQFISERDYNNMIDILLRSATDETQRLFRRKKFRSRVSTMNDTDASRASSKQKLTTRKD